MTKCGLGDKAPPSVPSKDRFLMRKKTSFGLIEFKFRDKHAGNTPVLVTLQLQVERRIARARKKKVYFENRKLQLKKKKACIFLQYVTS